ncbi:ABC transporter ATP-binding protein [Lottiidibacillus patelloidae]|uniref:ABC transporter ATP-binding protein n=1 Tax=Lottiidibacillus patelloidae TaxID=2670334 RepID=UPI001E4FAB9D|nr:ABC transporter ATP-binding protein [Lottiidibacillus patelloidae]
MKDIHLTIKTGEFFSLLGPSGCGKTTLLKLIAGLIIPTSGECHFNFKDITTIPAEKRSFSMVFQEPLLFPHMTIEDNVAFGLKVKGVPKKLRIDKAKQMLHAVGLKGYEKRYATQLSGGEQQRVSIARALVVEPKLLLLDEPFSALDPNLRDEMRELLRGLHHKLNVTCLFVTHDQDEAFQLSDRIGIMQSGELLQVGTGKQLYERPVSPEVAIFLGAKNVHYGRIDNGYFYCEDFPFKVENIIDDTTGWLIIRPEIFTPFIDEKSKDKALLRGLLKEVVFRQGFYYAAVLVGKATMEVTFQANVDYSFEINKEIVMSYNPSKLIFIPHNC